ncbi:hypothetical protein EMCRGX_G003663 [Ephydatia muelleri]
MKTMSLVDDIIAYLDEMRSSDDSFAFAIVWETAESLAETVDSDLKQPRLVAKQRNRIDVESSSDQEYFKRSGYYSFLDIGVQYLYGTVTGSESGNYYSSCSTKGLFRTLAVSHHGYPVD